MLTIKTPFASQAKLNLYREVGMYSRVVDRTIRIAFFAAIPLIPMIVIIVPR